MSDISIGLDTPSIQQAGAPGVLRSFMVLAYVTLVGSMAIGLSILVGAHLAA